MCCFSANLGHFTVSQSISSLHHAPCRYSSTPHVRLCFPFSYNTCFHFTSICCSPELGTMCVSVFRGGFALQYVWRPSLRGSLQCFCACVCVSNIVLRVTFRVLLPRGCPSSVPLRPHLSEPHAPCRLKLLLAALC